MLRRVFPPLHTPNDFPCSVASLRRYSFPQPPGHLPLQGGTLVEYMLGKGTPSAHSAERTPENNNPPTWPPLGLQRAASPSSCVTRSIALLAKT